MIIIVKLFNRRNKCLGNGCVCRGLLLPWLLPPEHPVRVKCRWVEALHSLQEIRLILLQVGVQRFVMVLDIDLNWLQPTAKEEGVMVQVGPNALRVPNDMFPCDVPRCLLMKAVGCDTITLLIFHKSDP